jgi:hypothetical protein
LVARYCRPFEILENIGLVQYMLALYTSMRVHNVFYVSLLNKYVPDPNQIIDWSVNQVEHEGVFRGESICIMNWKFKVLGNKSIGMVKV